MRLRNEDRKLREIRAYVDEEWGNAGPATDTPWPPEGM
jgi:hypothetical protein